MGNCINLMSSPPQKNKISVLVSNGGEEEFKASTKVRKITSGPYQGYDLVHYAQPNLPLPPNAKLLPAEIYVLIPQKGSQHSPQLSSKVVKNVDFREPQKVKIVVTRKQLEFLVRHAKGLKIMNINPKSFWDRDGSRKWQPSLSTIQE